MQYTFQVNGKAILPGQLTEMGIIVIISNAIVRYEACFTDTLQNLLSFLLAPEEVHVSYFVGVSIFDIFGDMFFSNFLAATSE